jgi:hypothetical protein
MPPNRLSSGFPARYLLCEDGCGTPKETVKSAACNHASGDLSAPRNAKETSEKQKNERPRLGENLFRTTWTAVVQPAATSTHKCGKTFGGRNHGCVLQCEADERKLLEKHVCARAFSRLRFRRFEIAARIPWPQVRVWPKTDSVK